MPANTITSQYARVNPDATQSNFTLYTQPRALVTIGNTTTFSPISYRIELNDHGQTDQGTIVLPLKGYYADWPQLTDPVSNQTLTDTINALTASGPTTASSLGPGKYLPVQIYGGFPSDPNQGAYHAKNLSKRFDGAIDQFTIDYRANSVTFLCRSLAALLVETKTNSYWSNQTTVQVITSMLSKELNGLMTLNYKSRVDSKGKTIPFLPIESIWSKDAVLGSRNLKLWDIILGCAEAENMRVWADGNVLYYWPTETTDNTSLYPPYGIDYQQDIIDLSVTHSPQFNRNIEVEVRSYQQKQRTAISSTTSQDASGTVNTQTRYTSGVSTPIWGTQQVLKYTTSYSTSGATSTTQSVATSAGGNRNTGFTNEPASTLKERYVFHIQNLTLPQCDQRALALWHIISEHEFNIIAKIPVAPQMLSILPSGLTRVNRNTRFWLKGTPHANVNTTKLERSYRAKRLTENFSVASEPGSESDGWTLEINAFNHALPQSGML